MFFIKQTVTFFFLIVLVGCTSGNLKKINNNNQKAISIDTPNNKYNIIFKESLKRKFNSNEKIKPQFNLKASITFESNETLSVRGLNVLNSTKAIIEYSLIDLRSNLLVKSGLIETFPALSSSSKSFYSKERSLEHIKDRLSQSSSNKLHMLINIILRKLN